MEMKNSGSRAGEGMQVDFAAGFGPLLELRTEGQLVGDSEAGRGGLNTLL